MQFRLERTRARCFPAWCTSWGISLLLVVTLHSISPAQGQTQDQSAPNGPQPVSTPLATAQVTGSVADSSEAMVPGATVLLTPADDSASSLQAPKATTDAEGRFSFAAVAPGRYRLTVAARGFDTPEPMQVQLLPGQRLELSTLKVKLPSTHADAYVTLNQHEIAVEEIKAAEQQRIVGFPDFYTSFVWNAAPLDARQKLGLGLRATTDRMAFVTAGLVASAEQIRNTFPAYGGGVQGFGKRYGAAYADGFIGKILGGAVLPAVFRQDPRYFYMGPNGTTKQRIWHAVSSGFLTRGDNGRTQPNYSHIFGNASAGALSTLYHPAADSAGKLALDNALLGTLGEAGVNVVREFFLKRFVRGGDVDARGMP